MTQAAPAPIASVATAADLKMSNVRPQDATIDVELRAFAAKVAEATGGLYVQAKSVGRTDVVAQAM